MALCIPADRRRAGSVCCTESTPTWSTRAANLARRVPSFEVRTVPITDCTRFRVMGRCSDPTLLSGSVLSPFPVPFARDDGRAADGRHGLRGSGRVRFTRPTRGPSSVWSKSASWSRSSVPTLFFSSPSALLVLFFSFPAATPELTNRQRLVVLPLAFPVSEARSQCASSFAPTRETLSCAHYDRHCVAAEAAPTDSRWEPVVTPEVPRSPFGVRFAVSAAVFCVTVYRRLSSRPSRPRTRRGRCRSDQTPTSI